MKRGRPEATGPNSDAENPGSTNTCMAVPGYRCAKYVLQI